MNVDVFIVLTIGTKWGTKGYYLAYLYPSTCGDRMSLTCMQRWGEGLAAEHYQNIFLAAGLNTLISP